jgi:hypothetical protein
MRLAAKRRARRSRNLSRRMVSLGFARAYRGPVRAEGSDGQNRTPAGARLGYIRSRSSFQMAKHALWNMSSRTPSRPSR